MYAPPFMSIRPLSSGRYQARWRPRKGKHLSATFKTQEECLEWLIEVEKQVLAERYNAKFEKIKEKNDD